MNIKEILQLSPEELVRAIDKGDISDAVVLTIPLDTALVNHQIGIAGNYISCIASTDAAVSVSLEFNRINTGVITFSQGLAFVRPFARIFLTCSAQAAKTITFIISNFYPLFGVQDNRSNQLQVTYLAAIQNELIGTLVGTFATDTTVGTTPVVKVIASNTSRKACMIQSDLTNTGIIYIAFDNTVASTKKIAALSPGQSIVFDDYRGDLYAVASVAAQKVSYGEW